MVSLRSFTATATSTEQVLAELGSAIDEAVINPDLVYAFYDCIHDDSAIFDFVQTRFPGVALLGGTSCNGVMNELGLSGAGSIGLLLLEDPAGNYGSAAVELGADAAACAEHALSAALAMADCVGELPELIWIYQAPGREEAVIEGLRRVIGDRCPIIGGSSADSTVEGNWRQLSPDGSMTNGLVVSVLFSSGGIGFGFQGGYEPTGPSGIVTRVGFAPGGDSGLVTKTSGRRIVSIDNEPAAEVYNRWVGGALSTKLASGGSVLIDTTMCPIGIDAGKIEDVTHYRLVHPDQITSDGVLSTFAMIKEGTRIHSMRGNKTRLIERAGKVASVAASALPGGIASLAGGLIVYCAGCMLAVDDQMPEVAKTVASSFKDRPFIGCFTFGEQGFMLDKNVHGNLMISAIAFGR